MHGLVGVMHIARSIVLIDHYLFPASNIMYRAKHMLVYVYSAIIQDIATMCMSIHIAPINMLEDPCAKHIGYSKYTTRSWVQCILMVTMRLSSIPSTY